MADNYYQVSPEDKVALAFFLKKLKLAEDYCKPYFDKAKRHYRLYRFGSAVDKEDWPYVNVTRTRDIFAFIEDSTALMVQTLFSTIPFFSAIAKKTSILKEMYGIDTQKLSKQIEQLLDYVVSHEDSEFFEEIVDYFKAGGIFGTSYLGIYPNIGPQGEFRIPLFKQADFWDVLPLPGASRLSRADGYFLREFYSREKYDKMVEQGVFLAIPQHIQGQAFSAGSTDMTWHTDLLREVGVEDFIPDWNELEVLHLFAEGHVVSVVNRMYVVRDTTKTAQPPYPYKLPMVQYKYISVPNETFGIGIPEVLETLQEDKNLVRSARRDNIDMIINKVIKTRVGADLNYDLLKYYPGAVWPMQDIHNDVEELRTTDVTQSAYIEEDKLKADMENALSFFGYARGMTPPHQEQPTTVLKLQQAALNRQDLLVKMAEFTSLQRIATRILLLCHTYMPIEQYEEIVGEKDAGFYKLTRADFMRTYSVKPVGSSITHIKEVRQKQIAFALQTLMTVPPQATQGNIQPFTIDLYELLKTALDTADIKNVDEILLPLNPNPMAGPPGGMPPEMMGMDPNQINALRSVMYGGG